MKNISKFNICIQTKLAVKINLKISQYIQILKINAKTKENLEFEIILPIVSNQIF